MKRAPFICAVAAVVLVAQAPQPAPVARPFLGAWQGTLTYRDYKSGAQVVLPTTLVVSQDGSRLQFDYVYDDGPGKIVKERDLVQIDVDGKTYSVESDGDTDRYAAEGLAELATTGSGTLVLSGTGSDDNRPVTVRETIVVTAKTLSMRREVRLQGGEYFTRHAYDFKRT